MFLRDQTQRALTTTNLQLAHYSAIGNQRAWTPEGFHTNQSAHSKVRGARQEVEPIPVVVPR